MNIRLWLRRKMLERRRVEVVSRMKRNFDLYSVAIRSLKFVQDEHQDLAIMVHNIDRQLESLAPTQARTKT